MTAYHERIVQVFALGSPHGDDQAAWKVAERLSQDPDIRPLVHVLTTPWDLIELLEPDSSVIVVDACVGGDRAGTVLRIGEESLSAAPIACRSTHGGSLRESLELAKGLQRNIHELVVFAIVVESYEPHAELSESAFRAVDDAVQQVQALLSKWLPRR